MTDLIRERLKSVPNRPGCYLMRDRRGVIIYVGKAKNLRRRVSSYFRPGAKHPPKVRSMVDTVYDFEFMTVRNEAESLLTEASLIKKYKPHFNILMRDDKRYLALRADPTADGNGVNCHMYTYKLMKPAVKCRKAYISSALSDWLYIHNLNQ